MIVNASVLVIGKTVTPWVDSQGNKKETRKINIAQNNGEIIDTLRLNEEQFNKIEAGKVYTIIADYGIGKNGGYLRITDIAENSK